MIRPPRARIPAAPKVSPSSKFNSTKKISGEHRPRPKIQIARRIELLDMAAAHQTDPIGHHERFLLVMRDIQDRHAEQLVQMLDLQLHLLAQLLVERAERFVHQHEARRGDQARASAMRCCWPPDSCVGLRAATPGRRTIAKRRADFAADFGFGQPAHPQRKRDVFRDRHVGKQRVILEHHAETAGTGRQVGDVAPVDPDPPRGRRHRARDQVQQCGFA